MSPVAVDVPVDYRRRRRGAVGAGEFGDRAVESARAITNAGLLFEHPGSRGYDPRGEIAEHPDTPERIDAIDGALAAVDWLGWERRVAPIATRAELEAVHDADLIDMIERLVAGGGGLIDADTHVDAAGYRAARNASGAACAMVRALMGGEARVAFAALRPSGHHAERSRAMGFCLFNNIAVAAQLRSTNWGCGACSSSTGTSTTATGPPRSSAAATTCCTRASTRPTPTPAAARCETPGPATGLGYTINLPVPAGSDGERWVSLLEHVVLPAATAFRPELVLISAGFDAHRADPLGGCQLESSDFARMARHVRDLAQRTRRPDRRRARGWL